MIMMTEDDKYALKEFLRAVGVTAGVFVVFCIIFLVIINLYKGGKPLEPSFEVVDTYQGCNVVQYTPTNSARYSYFLHCSK
jgi:hypothetical protein